MSGTEQKKKILSFISDFIDTNGYAPSYREIGAAIGLRSPSSVARYIDQLKAEGRLTERAGSKCRTIGTARRIDLRLQPEEAEQTQRIQLKVADGGIVCFDCSVLRGQDASLSLVFNGILDATRLRGNVGRVVFCNIDEADA